MEPVWGTGTKRLWRVLDKYGFRCWLCRKESAPVAKENFLESEYPRFWSVDHIQPKSKGGTNDIKNLAPAHKSCNSLRGTANPLFWRKFGKKVGF